MKKYSCHSCIKSMNYTWKRAYLCAESVLLHNKMYLMWRAIRRKSGKNNKFQKTIALLFMLMYNYSANEISLP